MSSAAVFIAEGFEEVEAVTVIDFLRRAGVRVVTVGVTGKTVTGSHQIPITTDEELAEVDASSFDAIILPGGMPGSLNLAKSKRVGEIVLAQHERNRLVAAICAAPAQVLAPLGVLSGRRATCFPGDESAFDASVHFSTERVVVDGTLITSRGAGTAAEFAEELIRQLVDDASAREVHRRTVQRD